MVQSPQEMSKELEELKKEIEFLKQRIYILELRGPQIIYVNTQPYNPMQPYIHPLLPTTCGAYG